MSRFSLNLARRPFVNQRPVVRLAVVSWIVGVGLAAVNGWLYYGYLGATRSQSSDLVEANQRIAREQAGLEAAERALAGLDLGHQNQRAAYLNDRIAERTLSWSRLFDDLATVLPRQVRLYSVTPQRARERQRAPGDTSPSQAAAIVVQLRGAGETNEAVLELVDALFGHPSFDAPDLRHETHAANGLTEFDLQVNYRPPAAAAATPTASPGAAAIAESATATPAPGVGAAMPGAAPAAAGTVPATSAPVPATSAAVPTLGAAATNPWARVEPPAAGVSTPARGTSAGLVAPGTPGAPNAPAPTFGRPLPAPLAAPASATRRLP